MKVVNYMMMKFGVLYEFTPFVFVKIRKKEISFLLPSISL